MMMTYDDDYNDVNNDDDDNDVNRDGDETGMIME